MRGSLDYQQSGSRRRTKYQWRYTMSVLDTAVKTRNITLVGQLLKRDAIIDKRLKTQASPLTMVIGNKNNDTTEIVFSKGADVV